MIPDSNIQGYAVRLSTPAAFESKRIALPVVPMSENWSLTQARTTTVFVYDGRTASPTYGTYINYTVNYNVIFRTKSAAGIRQKFQPVALQSSPGLQRHRLFMNFTFGSVVDYEQYVPIGFPTSTLNNSQTPHYVSYEWQAIRQIDYDGVLTGKCVIWFNGQSVGEIPIATGSAGTDKSTATQIARRDGSLVIQKNGGLEYVSNFDGVTRQIPEITFSGNCDQITVELSAIYKNSGAAGEFFAALISTN